MTLLKKMENWTANDFTAFADDPTAFGGRLDAMTPLVDGLRKRIEFGEQVFSAADLTLALNAIEMDRVLSHFLAEMIGGTIAKLNARFGRGKCVHCDWVFTIPFEVPIDRELTTEEVAALDDAHTTAIKAHVRGCPNHPMRSLEHDIDHLTAEMARRRKSIERRQAAFAVLDTALHEAHSAWDSDNDSRCGKLLASLSGTLLGYRPTIDEARAAIGSDLP